MKKLIVFFLLCSVALGEDKPYRILNSFNAGELSTLLSAREDLSKYHSGCSLMENMIPLPQGGAEKRPGTKYVAESKNNTKIRLLPFEYSTEQSYVIELGNQYARFYADSAQIMMPAGEDSSRYPQSASIKAHWTLNDLSGTTATDSEESHDGTISEDASVLTDTGQTAGAFDFAGSHKVTVTDHADFTFTGTTFSMAAWVYVIATAADQFIISKADADGSNEWLFVIDSSEQPCIWLYDETNNKWATLTADDALTVNAWYYIVATYDGTTGNSAADGLTLYVSGVAVAATALTIAGYDDMANGTADIIIANSDGDGGQFQDKLDNIAIWKGKELTSAEVASLYSLQTATSTTAYEIVTPYLTADLFELKYEQSADVLYITHPDYETKKVSRYADNWWTIDALGIENGPFRSQNSDVGAKIAASATTGSVTLTATGCTPFVAGTTAGHVPSGTASTSKSQTGALFKLVHPIDDLEFKEELESDFAAGQVEDTSWVDCGVLYKGTTWTLVTGDTWFGTIKVQRNYTLGAAVGNGADEGASLGWETVFTYSSGAGAAVDARNVSTTGTEDDGDAQYRVIYADETADDTVSVYFSTDQTEIVGIVEITAVTSSTVATGTVIETLGSTDATYKWSEGSLSNCRGWPPTVAFFEDRLCFGGNTSQPDTIWASVTADYENMESGVDDDDALNFTLSSRQVNVIEWLVGKDKLLIGTSGAEWTISGGTDEPLTPSNVVAKQHSTYGSANIQATLANESVLFFQRGKEKMRELAYNWEMDSYVSPDMTVLAPEITDGGIDDTDYQQTPNPILWCVRDANEICVFVYERKELITSWARLITDGDFESVAIISGTTESEVWVSVERVIDGDTVRYIEYFTPRDWDSDSNAFFVDCGITDTGGDATITGLSHLEGETVHILGDGVVLASETVSSGQITADSVCSKYQVGLPYTVQLKTMPLSWIMQGGQTIQGRIKRINEVLPRWYESGDFYIGKDYDNKELMSIDGITTSEERKTFQPGYDRSGYVYFYQQSAEPFTLLALMIEFLVF